MFFGFRLHLELLVHAKLPINLISQEETQWDPQSEKV